MTEKQAEALISIFTNIEYLIGFTCIILLCNTLLDAKEEDEVIKLKCGILTMIGVVFFLMRLLIS